MGLFAAIRRGVDRIEGMAYALTAPMIDDGPSPTEDQVEAVSSPGPLGQQGDVTRQELVKYMQSKAPRVLPSRSINSELLDEVNTILDGLARDSQGRGPEVHIKPMDSDDHVSFYGRVPLTSVFARIYALQLCRFVAQNSFLQHTKNLPPGNWAVGSQALNINAGSDHVTFQITYDRVLPRESRDGPEQPHGG